MNASNNQSGIDENFLEEYAPNTNATATTTYKPRYNSREQQKISFLLIKVLKLTSF